VASKEIIHYPLHTQHGGAEAVYNVFGLSPTGSFTNSSV